VNVKIKPARSFEGAHKDNMYLNVFINVSNHTYISICVYIVFLNKKKSSFTLFFGAFIPWHDSGPTNQLVAPFPPQQMTRLKESQTDPAPHPGPGRPSSPTPSSCSFPLATPTRPLRVRTPSCVTPKIFHIIGTFSGLIMYKHGFLVF
jgi:hypothetical protein